ncbi:MAG: hypothetical protein STSR0007_02820 [Thermovirga sp.]
MIPYREQKIENAITYFASEFHDRKGYYPRQTWIYKFLALLDFRTLKKTGIPCLGLEYDAMKYGPVPSRLYDERPGLEADKFRFVTTNDRGCRVEAKEDPDLDFFSDDELDVMDEILTAYTQEDSDLDTLVNDAHKEIRAWKKAWDLAVKDGRGRMPMEYADEFGNLSKKKEKDLTPEEERFLYYKDVTAIEKEMLFLESKCAG